MRLRQAVLIARELQPAVGSLQEQLGLGEPFRDPGVGAFGLANAVFAVGDCFIEIVCPLDGESSAARYLERFGEGGYMVMFDMRELAGARERAAGLGVRTVWEIELPDISSAHLHPRDMGGAIVSIDASRPYGSWRWGGPRWTGAVGSPESGALRGVVLAVHEPAARAERWAHVLGAPPPGAGKAPTLALEGSRVRFEAAPAEAAERLVEIELQPPGGGALDPAAAHPEVSELLGVRMRRVGAPALSR